MLLHPDCRATLLGGLGLLLILGISTVIQLQTGKVSSDTGPGVVMNNVLLLPVASVASLLYGLATEATGLARRQALGKASYCFYLLHMGVWHDHLAAWLPAAWPGLLRYGLVFLLTVATAGALYYLVEKPLHKLLLRRSGAAPFWPLAGVGQ